MTSSADQRLADEIERHLEGFMQASAMDINVNVHNGIVQLQGFVDTLDEKQTAEQITCKIPGVREVNNNLTICMEGNINDRHIKKEIESRLHSGEHRGLESVSVEMRDGSAVLVGTTENLSLERQAMNIAASTRGVKDVVSNINRENNGILDDVTIANRIVHALSTAHINLRDICTDVHDGEVMLSGWVMTQDEADLAENVASQVEGVRKIRNSLKTRGRQ